MAGSHKNLPAAVEGYLMDLRGMCASAGSAGKRSYGRAPVGSLRAVGATLSPAVFCVPEPADQRVGRPDCSFRGGESGWADSTPAPPRRLSRYGFMGARRWLQASFGWEPAESFRTENEAGFRPNTKVETDL